MSLDSIIENEKDNDNDSTSIDEWLSDVINEADEGNEDGSIIDPAREDVCPTCHTKDTEQVAYYWRCNNTDDCDVTTYIP